MKKLEIKNYKITSKIIGNRMKRLSGAELNLWKIYKVMTLIFQVRNQNG